MKKLSLLIAILFLYVVQGAEVNVVNLCSSTVPIVWRGPYDKVYYSGQLAPKQWFNASFSNSNCGSGCNVGINTGSTLLAEWDDDGTTTWWNLSTDAGYQWPPFRFFSAEPNGPNMYCGDPTCPDGTPGDSHINATPDKYDLFIQYCG